MNRQEKLEFLKLLDEKERRQNIQILSRRIKNPDLLSVEQLKVEIEIAIQVDSFKHDPLGYALYAFPWGEGPLKDKSLRTWQKEKLGLLSELLQKNAISVQEAVQLAISSGHGIGKSAFVAIVIMWAISTLEDARGVVTANTENQLKQKTWAELAKWHRMAKNTHWFEFTATAIYSKSPKHEKTWRIDQVTWSLANTEAFAGLHNEGKRVLLIFDEASAIPDKIWEVSEGALTDENTEILWLCFGNPTRNTGRFKDCFARFKHRWHHDQIDSRTVEGTNKVQLQNWVTDYGENSDFVKVRVRGMFPSASLKQFISIEDVDKAFGLELREDQYNFAPKILTVDPAWEGDDEFVIAMRQGLKFKVIRTIPKNDNDIQMASLIAAIEDEEKADAVFIDAGYGTGIVSAGKTMHRDWMLVWFGEASNDPGCLNKRAEMWKLMRDWLKAGGSLPKDTQLHDEIIAPETVARMDGKIQIEAKKDMKSRGVPSPNRADALALSFAFPVSKKSKVEEKKPQFYSGGSNGWMG